MTTRSPDVHVITVPANRLVYSIRNVRTGPRLNIEELAESIREQGLLQNLVVSREGDDYPVEAGERRRLAIKLLVELGLLPEDWPVPVILIDVDSSTSASTIENLHRQAMHPADQFAAWTKLTQTGWTLDRIARVYGVTTVDVERCLALAKASPALLELFRNDKITTAQLSALCSTDDHERQLSAWQNAPSWNRDPMYLRRAVLATEVESNRDDRVTFIGGPEAFVAAGGHVRRDLFSGDGEHGLIADIPLLIRLVNDKLEAEAAAVRAEGWGWVDIWQDWDYTLYHRLGHLKMSKTELPAEAVEELAALAEEHAELAAKVDAFEEYDDSNDDPTEEQTDRYEALCARMDEIDGLVERIEAAHTAYDPAAMATAGAVVAFDRGALRIERGLVKPEDRAKTAASLGGSGVIAGGRETAVAGRKAGGLSDALTRSLFGHRNLGAQMATAENPHVAKVLLAYWTVQQICGSRHGAPTDLYIRDGGGTRTMHEITDATAPEKKEAFEAIGRELVASLPPVGEALWDALMDLPADDLDALIAFGVASSVSISREHKGLSERLLTALGFDVADRFTTTAATYLSRVSKALILDALAEANVTTEEERTALLGMKKTDLVQRAESLLAPTHWVPPLIRTPGIAIVSTSVAVTSDEGSGPADIDSAAATVPVEQAPDATPVPATGSKRKRGTKTPAVADAASVPGPSMAEVAPVQEQAAAETALVPAEPAQEAAPVPAAKSKKRPGTKGKASVPPSTKGRRSKAARQAADPQVPERIAA